MLSSDSSQPIGFTVGKVDLLHLMLHALTLATSSLVGDKWANDLEKVDLWQFYFNESEVRNYSGNRLHLLTL